MATVRVRTDVSCVVDLDTPTPVALRPGMAFDSSDPVVKRHPDLFVADADAPPVKRVTSVPVGIEQMTAAPGERRNR